MESMKICVFRLFKYPSCKTTKRMLLNMVFGSACVYVSVNTPSLIGKIHMDLSSHIEMAQMLRGNKQLQVQVEAVIFQIIYF